MASLLSFSVPLAVTSLLAAALVATPTTVRADGPCELEGDGVIEDVQPDGTELGFALVGARAKVQLEGGVARVEALDPIAFTGRADARSVALTLGSETTVRGVVRVDAGVAVRARRVAGGRADVRVVAGPTAFMARVGCADLVFGERVDVTDARDAADSAARSHPSPARQGPTPQMLVRGDQLRVFVGANASRGLTLRRLRGARPRAEWPALTVLAGREGRLRVHGELAPGVTIEGWVPREELAPLRRLPHYGDGRTGGCGFAYAGTPSYRGPATLEAGAALMDAEGQTWGRTTRALDVAIVVVAMGRRIAADGSAEVIEALWVERIPGVRGSPCRSLGIRLRRGEVRYDERDDTRTRRSAGPARAPASPEPADTSR